jgi:glycogen synthase kinase 3 beta
MFAGLRHMHEVGITHRDLKPQNLLVDPDSGELKICDLGSAKRLIPGEQSVSYIASRYYRAPELIFECVYYTTAIDVWAAGCCLAETLMAGIPIFAGSSSIGQLHEIAKVLGRPTDEEMSTFQHATDIELPVEKEVALEDVLPKHTPPDILDLLSKIFVYSPSARPTALECLRHSCFEELFHLNIPLPSRRPFPLLDRGEGEWPRDRFCVKKLI